MAKKSSGGTAAANAPNRGEIIEAPKSLQAKVRAKGGTKLNLVPQAEYVVEKIKPEYEARFEADMRALNSRFVQMQDTGDFDLPLLVARIHDIRGEAGTFGYSLVTEIGRMLCEFIASIDEVGETERLAIAAHLQAMQTVVADKVKGQGPEVARQIIAGLKVIMGNTRD